MPRRGSGEPFPRGRSHLKIAFDSRPAGELRGIGRYTRSLHRALVELAGERGGDAVVRLRGRRADVLHTPWIDGAPLRPRVPNVVTLHDVIPLKRPGELLRSGLRMKMRYLAVERASRVIVPTAAVARDAASLLPLDPAAIHVVHEAADGVFRPQPPAEVARVRAVHGLPDPYLLWVGALRTPDPRKRVAALAAAARDVPLVLVGEATQWARELPGVQLTGAVADADLAAIYTGAHAVVSPSDDEGFGLTAVEALACGTPVVACDVPALREVLDGRAVLVDPDDLGGLVRAALSARRPAPAPPPWTWEDAARATWQVYEQARND